MKKVITYGTFDLLHRGHLRLLERAKALGDYLIVGVTSENYDRCRGKLNVQQSLPARIDAVRATGLADEILVEEYEGQKIDDILRLRVDTFAIGSDWVGRFDYLKEYCEVVYLERTKGISSTDLRDQQHPLIRFGVVGCGRIANRFIPESKFVSGCTVEGVFNAREHSARAFCEKHELSFWSSNYEDFLARVNALYIASPHETHADYAKRALEAGKHVLCEKPMALREKDARELYELARMRNLVLLEGIKTAYCPGFQRMVSCAKSGKIGAIRHIDATFTKLVPAHSRELSDTRFGGSMTELASYPLLAVFRLLGTDYQDVRFLTYRSAATGLDLFTQIELRYADAIGIAKVGLGVKSEGSLTVSGTRGYVYVPAPWWKTDAYELRYEDTADTEKNFYKFAGDGLRYEITEFLRRIASGSTDESAQRVSCAIAKMQQLFREGHDVTVLNARG